MQSRFFPSRRHLDTGQPKDRPRSQKRPAAEKQPNETRYSEQAAGCDGPAWARFAERNVVEFSTNALKALWLLAPLIEMPQVGRFLSLASGHQ
jgi:hypothetical protein